MKAMINGKEIELTETAVVFFDGITWDSVKELPGGARMRTSHHPCTLEVKVTDEGLILDIWHKDECIGTFGATAQELADDLCH